MITLKKAHLRVIYDDRHYVISIQNCDKLGQFAKWKFDPNPSLLLAVLKNHAPTFDEYDLNGDGDFGS